MRRLSTVVALLVLLFATPVHAQWGGAGWTAGIFAATNLTGTCSQVAELDVVGYVVVAEDQCTTILPMVQAHILFPVVSWFSVGPGVGVALGEGLVQQVGISVVVGFRSADRLITVGLGAWAEPGASVLQPQFVPGQFAPLGSDGRPMEPAYLITTNIRTAISVTIELF